MRLNHRAYTIFWSLLIAWVCCAPVARAKEKPQREFRELQRHAAQEAHQAVAVDETSFFAISSREIARYRKSDGKQLKKWAGAKDSHIRHLNSGVVVDGKLYCAHSNWPDYPLKNTVEVFDAKNLKHLESLKFSNTTGAINWIDRRNGAWWIAFAFYGELATVRKTHLVRFDDEWYAEGTWTFPDSVLKRFLPNSNSGGAWGPNGLLYTTGHDRGELYVLQVPETSGVLHHVGTLTAPIAGQGIAWDRSDIGTLFGIHRRQKQVVKLRITHTKEYASLRNQIQWVRDKNNPILPPRPAGSFDSTRCMNPWVLREGDQYRLFYAGGDDQSIHRIGVATASIKNLNRWNRKGPLLEIGLPDSFDARWCVLPHVVQTQKDQLHLYYTGNSGKGTGLSAFPGIGLATSVDGQNWNRYGNTPVLAPSGEPGSPDAIGIAGGSVLQLKRDDGTTEWRFYYTGCPTIGKPHLVNQQKTICLAVSNDGIHWKKRGTIMQRDPNRDYENVGVAGPVVLQRDDGTFQMWYSAIGSRWGYYCICYAESDNGYLWTRGAQYGDNLQLEPSKTGWDSQMVEYPTIIRENNRLRMFYCGNGYGRTGIGTALSSEIDLQK
ncbi:glycoside hydrolase family protein [Gimesia aquarii]|uniref:Glycosyl hydrolase family 32 N-terminal domain-containing protein n=1 Tax=Gimesia aquarii TaxID=2527964 RepID=A0A517VS34_9PLAN|nr:hypothetical protein [Gimesia aquarii]QDT95825.1 hypothetical protein V144x_12720 [Gimesia aquarii]